MEEDIEQNTQDEINEYIHDCCRYGDQEELKEICNDASMQKNINLEVLDNEQSTPQHKACANGHLDIVMYLVENGSKLLYNKNGSTPLHWAIINRHKDIVKYLIEYFDETIDVLYVNNANIAKSLLSTALDTNDEDVS